MRHWPMVPMSTRGRSGCHLSSKDEQLNLLRLTATEALELMKKGEISSTEFTDAYLSQIDRHDKDVFAYLNITADSARKRATEIDALGGRRPALALSLIHI